MSEEQKITPTPMGQLAIEIKIAKEKQRQMQNVIDDQKELIELVDVLEAQINPIEINMKREELLIYNTVASETDDAGKKKFTNDKARELEVTLRLEKNENYNKQSQALRKINEELSLAKRNLEKKSKYKSGLTAIMDIQKEILRTQTDIAITLGVD